MGTDKIQEKIGWGPKDLANRLKSFFVQEYFRSPIILWLLALSFLVNIGNLIILKVFIQPVDFPIILHYNVYFGVDVLDSWQKAYLLPIIGFFLLIINTLLGLYFYKQKERIASYILAIANLMIQLSLLVASISVILINY